MLFFRFIIKCSEAASPVNFLCFVAVFTVASDDSPALPLTSTNIHKMNRIGMALYITFLNTAAILLRFIFF